MPDDLSALFDPGLCTDLYENASHTLALVHRHEAIGNTLYNYPLKPSEVSHRIYLSRDGDGCPWSGRRLMRPGSDSPRRRADRLGLSARASAALASQSGIGKQARHDAQVVPPLVRPAVRIGGGRPSGEQRPVVRVFVQSTQGPCEIGRVTRLEPLEAVG